jgi:hypothetical protein
MAVLRGTQGLESQSQVVLSGFSQPVGDAGLAKAPKTPGIQDFLRLMSRSRCTWDHLLQKLLAIIKHGRREKQFQIFAGRPIRGSQIRRHPVIFIGFSSVAPSFR